MKHSVIFTNTPNKWDNALPLGNTVFGCMLFYNKEKLYMPMNHYEVYYNITKNVLPEDIFKNAKQFDDPGHFHREKKERAELNKPGPGEPHEFYNGYKEYAFNRGGYAIGDLSETYPPTGELVFSFDESLKEADSKLALYVEDAKVDFELEKDGNKLAINTITARKDCIISKVSQSDEKLLKNVRISFEPCRKLVMPEITYKQIDAHTFSYTVSRYLGKDDPKLFVFSGIISFVGAEGALEENKYGADIVITKADKDFYILTSVFTDWRYKDTLNDGIAEVRNYEKSIDAFYKEHKEYWDDFFTRSNISIPDKFLEHIYYINQYTLDCCSGKDGIMKHHACGLNGLWAIRQPNLWGSMWYWDVNIQASFAGAFSSNRLDWAKIFSDGYLSYKDLAKKFARDRHNFTGVAADYPAIFYYCIGPWCAQFLWFLYEYSLDKEYLRNEAYPIFLELAEFLTQAFEYDAETDTYNIYPDISPEQGPLSRNTTITVACTKYLYKFTLEAAEILGDNAPILEKVREQLGKLPEYAISENNNMHGAHYKDSWDAPDNQWLRHPSLLMPLYPIGEFDLASDKETIQLWSNTVDFVEENSEISIFGGSWISACASRLGRGQTALRLIYERVIDHMLRSNGLTAEETDHYINYCLMPRQMLYYPCMMEFTGQMLAAVNELLLQSNNGLIRVFPALPDGDLEMERMLKNGYYYSEYIDRYNKYDAWNDVCFDSLLAKGAFQIGASLKERKIEYIHILSKKGGTLRLTSPFINADLKVYCDGKAVDYTFENDIITFETLEGKEYIIAQKASDYVPYKHDEEYNSEVLERESFTKRKLFIGEDTNTQYHKAIDNFIRSWYLGNSRLDNHTLYKFDLGCVKDKAYAWGFMRQAYVNEKRRILGMPIILINEENMQYTDKIGYGFSDVSGLKAVDREGPDMWRRDFIEGTEDTEFMIETPRGQYEMLVISGDNDEDSVTILEAVNGRKSGGEIIRKGRYQCKLLPLVNEDDDEPVRLKISTLPGHKWKINAIFLNMIKGY